MKTTAIIVAAGSGSRFKSDTPKQFLEINGKPVIVHTIERFESAPSVDAIIVVLAADQTLDTSEFSKVSQVVVGGSTRAESVRNGLDAAGDADIVAVHDGARPLVTVDEIERTIAKAKETGAACLVAPMTDSIKVVEGGKIKRSLDRSELRRALTPQVFRAEILRHAFTSRSSDAAATDEVTLVERLDYFYEIAVVEGSPQNIKITHPEDLILAEALLSLEPRIQAAV